MNRGDCKYIWQANDWPSWRYDLAALAVGMADVSRAQGLLLGRLADVGMALRDQASLGALTEDVVKTSEIEGEQARCRIRAFVHRPSSWRGHRRPGPG
jgi:Fic family protein